MNNRYLKSFVLSMLSALLLVACGGGGGGGSPAVTQDPPADPDAFSLKPVKSLDSNTLSFALTGSDTNHVNYTATLKLTNTTNLTIQDPVTKKTINNVTSIKAESSLTNTDTKEKATAVGTSYYTPGYQLVITTVGNPVSTCVPSTYNSPPDSVLIGDQGDNFATLTCATINTKIYITWRLEAGASADEAKFVVTETSYVGDKLDTTEETRYIINKAGTVKGIEVKVTSNEVIRELAGNAL